MMCSSVNDLCKQLLLVWVILAACPPSVLSFSIDSTKSNESDDVGLGQSSEGSDHSSDNFTAKELNAHAQPSSISEAPNSIDLAALAAGKYEIRSISGEPNYKSVNLTWDMEYVPLTAKDIICNSSDNGEPPKAFQIFICEMQTFGPHRCRAKVVDIPGANQDDNTWHMARHYMARIDNLRMATKYSFHVRPQFRRRNLKIMGRSEIFHNGLEEDEADIRGHTIIIPTKGFAAEATKCLPNASEIQVETGPDFGGKIMVDGGKCVLKGNPNNPAELYTMRIDHIRCGSMIKPETNTVETFITVQENLGIFTHSTRRFVVVCSYQSGMQTVRASFSVPGRGGATAVDDVMMTSGEEERRGRGLKPPMKYVSKSSLIRKEQNEEQEKEEEVEEEEFLSNTPETEATVQEMMNPIALEQEHRSSDDHLKRSSMNSVDKDITYAKFMLDHHTFNVAEKELSASELSRKKERIAIWSKLLVDANLGAIVITIVLSLVFLLAILWVMQRIRAVIRSQSTTTTADHIIDTKKTSIAKNTTTTATTTTTPISLRKSPSSSINHKQHPINIISKHQDLLA